jgi:hypothetical protein
VHLTLKGRCEILIGISKEERPLEKCNRKFKSDFHIHVVCHGTVVSEDYIETVLNDVLLGIW